MDEYHRALRNRFPRAKSLRRFFSVENVFKVEGCVRTANKIGLNQIINWWIGMKISK